MRFFIRFCLLILFCGTAFSQGLVEPIDFYEDTIEEDSSWEETMPALMPEISSEIGHL